MNTSAREDNPTTMGPAPAIWNTLRHRQFRALWGSGGVYFIGNAMQVMAAAWLMVELTGSDFLAAAVQTAVFLPMFLLALPAGVLADITDRRRLILASLLTQAVSGTLLAALLFASWATLLYAGIAFLAVLLFVRFYEEPTLESTYGEEYREYRRNVRGWMPRLRPWGRSD